MKNIAKKLFIITATVVILCAISLLASAETYGDLTYEITDGNVTITDCSQSATEVVIPETIDGYPVTAIGQEAFYECISLISISIPDSVKSIGTIAFGSCTSLTTVTIPDSVTSIGDYAFCYCTSLTSITIPDSVTSISDYTFLDCTNLTSINIPDSITSIGDLAFYFCSSLTDINFPDSVTSIGMGAFASCTSLTSINIPDSITTIGSYAFASCTSLTSINIPDSVTSISEGAFSDCSALTNFTVSENITSIGKHAFQNCTALTKINWNVKNIDGYTELSEVFANAGTGGDGIEFVFGDTVEKIPDNLFTTFFYPAIKLKSITIGNSITEIGNNVFAGFTTLESVTIGNSVTTIGERAFENCSSLKSIDIPESVTLISNIAFKNSGLEKITINNPKCVIEYNVSTIPASAVIYGHTDSFAHTYAQMYNKQFVPIVTPCQHISAKWETVQAAQIGIDGKEQQKCTECGHILDERIIPALNPQYTPGDANGDGKTNAADARIILRISAKIDNLEKYNLPLEALDMTGDGKLNAADARKVLRISAKLE